MNSKKIVSVLVAATLCSLMVAGAQTPPKTMKPKMSKMSKTMKPKMSKMSKMSKMKKMKMKTSKMSKMKSPAPKM